MSLHTTVYANSNATAATAGWDDEMWTLAYWLEQGQYGATRAVPHRQPVTVWHTDAAEALEALVRATGGAPAGFEAARHDLLVALGQMPGEPIGTMVGREGA